MISLFAARRRPARMRAQHPTGRAATLLGDLPEFCCRFTWLTALGSLPWVVGFALLGRAVGDNWEQWRNHLKVLDYLVVAAIIGEELGFLGVAALCAAYFLLVARGVRAALRAPDDFGSFLAFGLSTMFGVQALVNLSVALAILPTKGLTLPFVSFGGSSQLTVLLCIGILMSLDRQNRQQTRW